MNPEIEAILFILGLFIVLFLLGHAGEIVQRLIAWQRYGKETEEMLEEFQSKRFETPEPPKNLNPTYIKVISQMNRFFDETESFGPHHKTAVSIFQEADRVWYEFERGIIPLSSVSDRYDQLENQLILALGD